MKLKLHSMVMVLLLFVAIVTGCSTSSQLKLVDDKVNVFTSFYPLYDFAKKIAGEHAHVVNLVPAGVEPHDWSPKSGVIRTLTQSDVFVYHGLGFESWVDDFLHSLSSDSTLIVVEAVKGVDVLLASEHTEAHSEEVITHETESNEQHEDSHEQGEYDPHTWLSPIQAIQLATNIRDGLIAADPDHQADYQTNYAKLVDQLMNLDTKFRTALAPIAKKEIAVSHQAFTYLAHEYGLTQVAFMGLSPDAEPTAQKMKEVTEFIREHEVKVIFFEELVSDKLAKTLANDLNIQTLVLNPLEGLTDEQFAAGMDYFSMMEKNLEHLLVALQK